MTADTMVPVEVGRVLYASTTEYTFGCPAAETRERVPVFGSLVGTDSGGVRVYAVVYDVRVNDDPLVRQLAGNAEIPSLYVKDQHYNRQAPVEIAALAVGYRRGAAAPERSLPPRPPMSLDRVFACSREDLIEFSQELSYFTLLLGASMPVPAEELLAVHLRQAADARPEPERRAFLVRAGKELARLLSGDLLRLDAILRRVKG